MNNEELQTMINILSSDINKLAAVMKNNPTNRKNIDELVVSYNMYISCIEMAKNRNISIPSFDKENLKKIHRELIKYDILTEKEYFENGGLGNRRL